MSTLVRLRYAQLITTIAGLVAILSSMHLLYDLGKENNSYLRTMVCIASVTPIKRIPSYTKSCYEQAEAHNGNSIDRFGDGR